MNKQNLRNFFTHLDIVQVEVVNIFSKFPSKCLCNLSFMSRRKSSKRVSMLNCNCNALQNDSISSEHTQCADLKRLGRFEKRDLQGSTLCPFAEIFF